MKAHPYWPKFSKIMSCTISTSAMIIATFFAIGDEFLWLCLSPPKDSMQVKLQNLIPLKLQGKEHVRRQRQWRKSLILSNRSSHVTIFNSLEEEGHHEKELICGHSLRSDGELAETDMELNVEYFAHTICICLFTCLMYNSKYYVAIEFPAQAPFFGLFWM